MSLTIESYTQNDIYVEYEWDKYEPHYIVFVGRNVNGVVRTLWTKNYFTKEEAKRSYQRQIRKIKKGEIR